MSVYLAQKWKSSNEPVLNTVHRRGRRWARRWAEWLSWVDKAERGRGRSQWQVGTAPAHGNGRAHRPAERRSFEQARQVAAEGPVVRSLYELHLRVILSLVVRFLCAPHCRVILPVRWWSSCFRPDSRWPGSSDHHRSTLDCPPMRQSSVAVGGRCSYQHVCLSTVVMSVRWVDCWCWTFLRLNVGWVMRWVIRW